MKELTGTILGLIKQRRKELIRDYMSAVKEEGGARAALEAYNNKEKDFGPSFGPDYFTLAKRANERLLIAEKNVKYIDSVYDYAVETFIGDN